MALIDRILTIIAFERHTIGDWKRPIGSWCRESFQRMPRITRPALGPPCTTTHEQHISAPRKRLCCDHHRGKAQNAKGISGPCAMAWSWSLDAGTWYLRIGAELL